MVTEKRQTLYVNGTVDIESSIIIHLMHSEFQNAIYSSEQRITLFVVQCATHIRIHLLWYHSGCLMSVYCRCVCKIYWLDTCEFVSVYYNKCLLQVSPVYECFSIFLFFCISLFFYRLFSFSSFFLFVFLHFAILWNDCIYYKQPYHVIFISTLTPVDEVYLNV